MKKHDTDEAEASRVSWDALEKWAREQVQGWLQQALVAEVTEFLGRQSHERRGVDQEGYRNGLGKPRRLTMSVGTVRVRRPRVRGLQERFESQLLPLFVRRTTQVRDLLPELYLHGLAEGDFEMALRGLFGEGAALSGSTVARLKEGWQAEMAAWNQRRLEALQPVYVWADGVYIKAGLEKEKAALLVVMAGLKDGSKVTLAVKPGYRESRDSWSAVLRDLKDRGLPEPALVVGDGHLGIWAALRNVYPGAAQQRCWNHRIVNVLTQVPKTRHPEARKLLTDIPYAETKKQATNKRKEFQRWAQQAGYQRAAELIEEDWERMVEFYNFPKAHWRHLRTTNVVESPFAALRLRTDAAKRFKKVANATAVTWKMLLVGETKYRKLNTPHLLADVIAGVRYEDGLKAVAPKEPNQEGAAA